MIHNFPMLCHHSWSTPLMSHRTGRRRLQLLRVDSSQSSGYFFYGLSLYRYPCRSTWISRMLARKTPASRPCFSNTTNAFSGFSRNSSSAGVSDPDSVFPMKTACSNCMDIRHRFLWITSKFFVLPLIRWPLFPVQGKSASFATGARRLAMFLNVESIRIPSGE